MNPWEALDLATALKETRGPDYRPMPDTASPPRRLEYNGAHTSPAVLKGEALDALRDYNEWRGSYSSDIPGSPHMTHPFFSRTVPGLPTMRRDAPGWIDRVAAQGRNGDTELAHVTPAEKDLLQALGGSGTRNPTTGLPEFYDTFGGVNENLGTMSGDPRGESTAGPGGSVGMSTSPGMAVDAAVSYGSTPSNEPSLVAPAKSGGTTMTDRLANTGAGLVGNLLGLGGIGTIFGASSALGGPSFSDFGKAQLDLLTKGLPEAVSALMSGQATASTPELTAERLGLSGQAGGQGAMLPDSSTIAATADTASTSASTLAPSTASKSLIPQSPISGLDAQTYDYLKRMGILA